MPVRRVMGVHALAPPTHAPRVWVHHVDTPQVAALIHIQQSHLQYFRSTRLPGSGTLLSPRSRFPYPSTLDTAT